MFDVYCGVSVSFCIIESAFDRLVEDGELSDGWAHEALEVELLCFNDGESLLGWAHEALEVEFAPIFKVIIHNIVGIIMT